MGLFSGRREAREREEAARQAEKEREAAEAADPIAPMKRRFAAAAGRGSLDQASELLDQYLGEHPTDAGPADYEEGPSLLERGASVRRALREGNLDRAAQLLEDWPLHPPRTAFGEDRTTELPNLNSAGMLLIDFFSISGVEGHPRYDTLMDTELANVAKWTRLSSPMPRPGGFFDRVYAEIKSNRELSRRTASS